MRIMIVDDDVEMVEMLRRLVDWEELGMTEVLTATGGKEAFESVGERRIDLLLSDIGMPGMDGYELVRRLREKSPDMSVIFLTCHEDFDYARQAIKVGADEYLLKYSLTADQLFGAVSEVLNRSRREREASSDEAADGGDEKAVFYGSEDRAAGADKVSFARMLYTDYCGYDQRFKESLRKPDALVTLNDICDEILEKLYDPDMVRMLFRSFDHYINRETARCGGEPHSVSYEGLPYDVCCKMLSKQCEGYMELIRSPGVRAVNEDVEEALRYIDDNLGTKITLQSVARHIYKNSSYFSRLFKLHTGMSFTDYLTNRRLEKATELLEESNLSIEEISERIGIDNVSYFYQFYKRGTGRTPNNVRRRAQ